jgi:hypothetical protein
MTFAPFPLQQARFFTVDPFGAVLASAAVLAATRRRFRVAGALAGLAFACKASLIWVFIPILWASISSQQPSSLRRYAAEMLRRCLLPALLAFALVSPWSLLRPIACWRGPLAQAAMAAGRLDFPYTRQYAGTLPYVYPLLQMALAGFGLPVTFAGTMGLGTLLFRWRIESFRAKVLGIWMLSFFALTAGLYVKFPRYLLPIYPVWIAWAVCQRQRFVQRCLEKLSLTWFPVRPLVRAWLLLLSILLGLAQFSLYTQAHPWIMASRWMYSNLLPSETIAVEMWDHALPVPLPGYETVPYPQQTLPIFDEDTPEKLAQLEAALEDAEVIVFASRRGYAALARQPERYAQTLAWYERVFAEREIIAFGRCPRLGLLALSDNPLADAGLPVVVPLEQRCGTSQVLRLPRLDESYRVYDAPVVLLALKH